MLHLWLCPELTSPPYALQEQVLHLCDALQQAGAQRGLVLAGPVMVGRHTVPWRVVQAVGNTK